MSMIIAGKDCEDCNNCVFLNEDSKRNIKVFCRAKEREYYYGQCIPCEFKIKKKKVVNEDEEDC